jgi:hypothetical protein
MSKHFKVLAVSAALLTLTIGLAAHDITGPSSSQSPYLVRSAPGVVIKSILTTGDAALNGYRLVGVPDGLGAFDNGDGTFTVLMNHELAANLGIPRAHGAAGAFVSKWIIRTSDLMVLSGEDLIHSVATWNPSTGTWNAPAGGITFTRFCSATLAAQSAFFDAATGLGSRERIYTNGEENGMAGRAMAHLMDGTSYELPHLGKAAWENIGPNPGTGVRTVVAATDDSASGQVYVYAGTKNGSPHPIEAAGLANGLLYGVQVAGLAHETDTTTLAPGTPFSLWNFGDVSNRSGIELEADSLAAGVTAFNRPEDGAWDPSNPNDFYFVTTATFPGRSRLWRLRFVDAARPALGGTADMLLDGTEGQHMFDNMIVTHRGRVILQEDPGNQPYLARVWQYDIARDSLALIAQHDPGRFTPGAPDFLTTDEESSGVIEATGILGEGWFLADVQEASPSPDPELVSGGQLLALHIPAGRRF